MHERYEELQGRYQAVVTQRDQLQGRVETLEQRLKIAEEALARYQGKEMQAIVCDNRCGRAIIGIDEAAINAEADRLEWFRTPPTAPLRRDFCAACHALMQTPL